MMRRILKISFILLLGVQLITAQQDPNYSQSMFNMAAYNPGYAGSNDMVCLTGIARQQWTGIDRAPQTSFFNVNMPVKPFGISSGIGLSIMNDVYGFNNDLGLNATYAYRMSAGDGKLGIGASFGVFNPGIDGADFQVYDEGTVEPAPSGVFPTTENPFIFDMGFGLFYRLDNMYMGISTTHLIESPISYKEASIKPYIKRHYYITSGYNLQLGNPLFELIPSFLVQSDGKVSQLALNTNILYNKKIWGGVSYRVGDALIGMLGFELFNGLRLGYAYDFEMNALKSQAGGTHELFVGYCFSLKVDKEPQQYKSIRFL